MGYVCVPFNMGNEVPGCVRITRSLSLSSKSSKSEHSASAARLALSCTFDTKSLILFYIFAFVFFSIFAGSISPKNEVQSVVADVPWDGALVGPSFDSGPESVVVSVGSPAYLSCRVRQLGDRKVSRFLFFRLSYDPSGGHRGARCGGSRVSARA